MQLLKQMRPCNCLLPVLAAAEASNSQILRQTGTFSIVNDDFAAITIDDVSGSESGTISIGLSVNFGGCRWVYPDSTER